MKKFVLTMLLVGVFATSISGLAFAVSGYATDFQTAYPSSPLSSLSTVSGQAGNLCTVCHGPSGGTRNTFGNNFASSSIAGHSSRTFDAALGALDSDGDGATNITEINAGFFPGNAASTPPTTDAIAPTVTTFTIPASSSSLTVAITSLVATDNNAVTGYLVNESATTPLAGAAGWSTTVPANYTFASAGAKTLYAWAKDAAGNVSASRSAPVTVTLADAIAPTVTIFTIPASSSSLTVAITSLVATDNNAVTGYLVNESATTPLAGAAGWSTTVPANYTFASAGAKTLYAWAKDAAGNVSVSNSASVTITLPPVADKKAPKIKSFKIPKRSSSLTVPINALIAVDRVGVTGYQVSESLIPDDNNWSATAPASHTFATAGKKKLFAFVKDAAGNVARARRFVVIRLPEIAAEAVEPAVIDTAVATAASKQIYSYDPVSSPVRSSNAAEAKPVAIGPIAEGGDGLSLQVSIAAPDSAMDAYVTIYSPSETITDPVIVYTLTAENELVPLTADKKPWRTQVTDVNEIILEIPTAEILQGKYLVSFELTATGTQDTNYLWWTYFIVK